MISAPSAADPGAAVLTASSDAGAPAARRRQAADKRKLILDAAIKVFARKGYHGSRVSDIAREAGIAYGLVYHYFKNKDEILETVFGERWSAFLEAVEAIATGNASTENKLLSIAALVLNAYRVREDWVKILVFEIQRSSRFAQPGRLRAMGRLFQLVAGILREGQESGELRRDLDPEVACYVFIGGLDIVVTSRVLRLIRIEGGPDAESNYDAKVARTVVELFLNGLRAPSGAAAGPGDDGAAGGKESGTR